MRFLFRTRPYRFRPPDRKTRWYRALLPLVGPVLRLLYRVTGFRVRGIERLRATLSAGRAVLLPANHAKDADPGLMVKLSQAVGRPFHFMASCELFDQHHGFDGWLLSHFGAFSVDRAGADKASLEMAVDVLAEGVRPLVVFPEGTVYNTNDRVGPFLDGVSFIAREASRRRTRDGRPPVAIHPVAIKYFYQGDLRDRMSQCLARIERRLGYRPRRGDDLVDRLYHAGEVFLSRHEKALGLDASNRNLPLGVRLEAFVARKLEGLETAITGRVQTGETIHRVRRMQAAVVADLIEHPADSELHRVRTGQLEDILQILQAVSYPGDYVSRHPSTERLAETLEKLEDDVLGAGGPMGPMRAEIVVCPAMPVPTEAPRLGPRRREASDPLSARIQSAIQREINRLTAEHEERRGGRTLLLPSRPRAAVS